jgi:hypothetical protein
VSTPMSQAPESSIAYRQQVDELIAALQTDQHRGLTGEERERDSNTPDATNSLPNRRSLPRRFLAQFQDVLVILGRAVLIPDGVQSHKTIANSAIATLVRQVADDPCRSCGCPPRRGRSDHPD